MRPVDTGIIQVPKVSTVLLLSSKLLTLISILPLLQVTGLTVKLCVYVCVCIFLLHHPSSVVFLIVLAPSAITK